MIEIPDFTNELNPEIQLGNWLDLQSNIDSRLLAARVALRVFPIFGALQTTGSKTTSHDTLKEILLPSLRALVLSWAGANFPTLGREIRYPPYDINARKGYSPPRYDFGANIAAQNASIKSNDPAVSAAAEAAAQAASVYHQASIAAAHGAAYANRDAHNAFSARAFQEPYKEWDTVSKAAAQAFISDIRWMTAGETQEECVQLAQLLARKSLWLEGIPRDILAEWDSLVRALPQGEYWDVWTRWYEDRLKGHPANEELELFRVLQPEEFWSQEPAVINKAIWDKEQEILARQKDVVEAPSSPPEIPAQLPGIHVEIDNDSGKIVFAPPASLDAEGNNIVKLQSFQPQIKRLAEEALGNISANEQPELRGALARYFDLIDKPLGEINFDLVYAEGLYLEEAADAANRKVAQGLREPLSDAGLAALTSLNRLHPLFVLNSKAGQDNLALAREYEATEEERQNQREAQIEFAKALKNAPDIISPDVSATFDRIVREEDSSQHPERTGSTRLAFAYNVTICLAIGAAPSAMAAGLGYLISGTTGAAIGSLVPLANALQNLVNESLKQTDGFKNLREPLTGKMNKVQSIEFEKRAKNLNQTISESYKAFLQATEGTLRKLAGTSKHMQWVHKNLDWLKSGFKSGPKN